MPQIRVKRAYSPRKTRISLIPQAGFCSVSVRVRVRFGSAGRVRAGWCAGEFSGRAQVSSILFWGYYGTHYRVKIISSFWGIVFYIRNIILLGSTTKKRLLRCVSGPLVISRRRFRIRSPNGALAWSVVRIGSLDSAPMRSSVENLISRRRSCVERPQNPISRRPSRVQPRASTLTRPNTERVVDPKQNSEDATIVFMKGDTRSLDCSSHRSCNPLKGNPLIT